MALRPYQDLAADFLYGRDRAMILAPVGAGKTALTLTAIRDMLAAGVAKRFLVLAPKRVAVSVWPTEAKLWAPDLRLAVAVGTPRQREAAIHSDTDVVVTNYDNVQTLPGLRSFDAVVFDELTRLKNPTGARFKALAKLIDHIQIRWGLTGSFTSNGLEDVFGQCKIVDQSLLGRSKGAFQQQYFYCVNRDFGEYEPLPGSIEKVMDRIHPATFVLEPGEYADTLPPLHTVEMRCDLGDRTAYEAMKRDFMVQFPTAAAVATSAAVVTGKLQQMASGFVYAEGQVVWHDTAKFDLLDDLLAEGQRANTIVVYQYRAELAELQRRYPRACTLDEPDAIERWNAGRIELLLVHPRSAGHGLNLQYGGSRIVFLSLPWSLEFYEQTVGRLHRSGQRHDVWCYVLMANATVDEKVWAALHDKRSLSQLAMESLR